MPVVLSYPGVYVEEIPSGQFTITGVATSITAFVGRALSGPVDQPITLFSFGDYQRMFGGLGYDFPLSYAVLDFFMNGGGQAVVARLFEPNTSLSAADWNTNGASALKLIKDALTPPTGAANATFNPAILLKAANDALAMASGPDQSMAQTMLQGFTIAAKNATTAPAFAAAVAALSVPPYPSVTAAMSLDSSGGGALAAPSVAVASAVIQAVFDASGNTANPAASVAVLQGAASGAASTIQDNPQLKIARAASKACTGADAKSIIDVALVAIGSSVTTVMGNAVPPGIDNLNLLVTRIGQAADPLFVMPVAAKPVTPVAPLTGAAVAPVVTPVVAPVTPAVKPATGVDMATLIASKLATPALTGSALAAGTAVGAAATSAATAGANVAGVIQAALQAAATEAFSVPDGQVLALVAASAGAWGNNLTATIDVDNISDHTAKIFAKAGLAKSDLFNLTVFCKRADGTTDIERFANVTVKQMPGEKKPLPNRIDLVLADQSQYVRVAANSNNQPVLPAGAPTVATGTSAGGNDGQYLQIATYVGDQNQKTGIYMLEKIDLFNLLCIPPDDRVTARDTDPEVYQEAMAYCTSRRAVLIVDPPTDWTNRYKTGRLDTITPELLQLYGTQTRNAAVYFPRVIKEDLMMDGQLDTFPACGAIAGVIAASDVRRGVWKAPAGQNAGLNNISCLELSLTDDEQGELNPLGINCLRNLPPLGPVVWGARTLRGADQLSDDFKYLSVRRLALFLEESLYRGTRWAVFEPNNEALWSSLRLAISAFLGDLAKQGAFYGFQIKCDKDTNSQSNIDKGIVTVLVQYAPVKPGDFVVLQFQQQAGLSPS